MMCTRKLITGMKYHTAKSRDMNIQFLRVGNCAMFIPVIASSAPEKPTVASPGDTMIYASIPEMYIRGTMRYLFISRLLIAVYMHQQLQSRWNMLACISWYVTAFAFIPVRYVVYRYKTARSMIRVIFTGRIPTFFDANNRNRSGIAVLHINGMG